jgi:hypothetical protein
MQTLRPHEQAKVDRAKLAYNGGNTPHTQAPLNRINYTGNRYQHKLSKVIYLEVSSTKSCLSSSPVMCWVQPEGEEKITTIPFSLLDEI